MVMSMVMRFGERLTAGERGREGAGSDRAEGGTLGEAGCYATDKHGDGEVVSGEVDRAWCTQLGIPAPSREAVTLRARPEKRRPKVVVKSLGQPHPTAAT